MAWHMRYCHHPAHKWLRGLMSELGRALVAL
jgi:hypothetical protein